MHKLRGRRIDKMLSVWRLHRVSFTDIIQMNKILWLEYIQVSLDARVRIQQVSM